ncbi:MULTISPECIES: nucleotidyltransferase family protein [unclassified Clostridium]|uniref:nucleotidyltransferase family protein n=1 Tax=unclassified Clostridium TaxID=2614128 RepID=UPI0025C41770|nr:MULTISPECIES: nucleotidyltransferase domain-containing protein [unclassified Clostridium]
MFGLLDRDIKYILQAMSKLKEIERAVIFGSRAMGNYKKGSDVDMVIMGNNITKDTILQLDEYLNEIYPLPYFFDIINYNEISNKKLKEHIDKVGKEIYVRK